MSDVKLVSFRAFTMTDHTVRPISYSAAFNVSGNAYLSIYGWSADLRNEYHIVESFGSYDPGSTPGAQKLGSLSSDGGTYDLYRTQSVNQTSIQGTLAQSLLSTTSTRGVSAPSTLIHSIFSSLLLKVMEVMETFEYLLPPKAGPSEVGGLDSVSRQVAHKLLS